MPVGGNAAAWGLPGVMRFFEKERSSPDQVYPSERFFLDRLLHDGISVLDIGCAQGGFATALGESIADLNYTGIDINPDMIAAARRRHPNHTFHHVAEDNYAVLGDQRFDLVLVLGILHLHESWRRTLEIGWRHAAGTLLFDLREVDGESIEDKGRSYFLMDFGDGGAEHLETRLPYNLINAAEAQRVVSEICLGARRISRYGYFHPVSPSARCPVDRVMTDTWCAER